MKKTGLILPILILLLLLTSCGSTGTGNSAVKAVGGVFDISRLDLDEAGLLRLDGQWEFYAGRIIGPGGFCSAQPTGYYEVPEYWTKYAGLDLSAKDCATYRLLVRTDGEIRELSIRMPEIYTEYSLFINGACIEKNGGFAGGPATYLHPGTYEFASDGTDIEIVLQIKNDAHANAGVGQSILLGTAKAMQNRNAAESALDLIVITFCLSAGLYHLIYYLFRRKDSELLYFCTLCLASTVRTAFSNETLIMRVFPDMAFITGSRIVTITVPVIVMSALLYTYKLFKDDAPKAVAYLLCAVSGLYVLMTLAFSPYVYSFAFYIYLYTLIADAAFAVYVLARALIKKRPTAVYYFAGSVFLFVGGTVDALAFNQAISSQYVFSICLCAFIASQTVLLAKQYSDAYRNVEELSKSLEKSLKRIMSTETAFLSAQMKPHFVYNALNTIAECCATDPSEAESLILSLSRYLRGTLDFENLGGVIPLSREIELVKAYVSIEKARFENISVEFQIGDGVGSVMLPPLTLQPLVENSLKHGIREKGTGGAVIVRITKQDGSVRFEVEDNGTGMREDVFAALLSEPAANSGIGLYNINARLTSFYGKGLSIRSAPGVGTLISFEIPFEEEN